MGTSVAFSYQTWITRYPEFSNVLEPQATLFFNEATIYLRNDGCGPVNSALIQLSALNSLTAHIAMLSVGTANNPLSAPAPVGRLSGVGEGSVSAQFEMKSPEAAAFFMQTQYGAAAWQMLAGYRVARYVPGPGSCGYGFGGRFPYG